MTPRAVWFKYGSPDAWSSCSEAMQQVALTWPTAQRFLCNDATCRPRPGDVVLSFPTADPATWETECL